MLSGKKVTLRPIVKEDIHVLNKWKNDEDVFRFLGGGYQPMSKDQQEKWMDSLIDLTGSSRRFIIADPDGNPAGMIGLYNIHWVHRTCEIGVYIGESSARGKGYASDACAVLENYAFQYLNLRKIKLQVASDNIPAYSMWEKLGYKKVGEYLEDRFITGMYHNVSLMEKFSAGGGKPNRFSLLGMCS